MATKITIAEFINRVAFKLDKSSVDKVNATIKDIKSTATKLLGTIGIGLSLTAANALVEEFGRVNEQIRNSTAALGDQADIQKKIMDAASATRSSYAATAGVISDLVHESPKLFGNIDEAVKFNNAATMLFKSAGKTNEEISGLMEAINKSFAKGYVDSETVSQLLEKSPEAVELLNKKLGTTSDKLEELASSRAMTVADLKAAFVDNADAIEQKFSNVQYRISDALTVIRNKWGLWLAQMDSALGITNSIARAMVRFSDAAMSGMNKVRNAVVWLCDKLGGADKLFRLLAISVGTVFGVRALATVYKFIKGLKTLDVAALGVKLKIAGIMAAIVLLALLVEDFINFLQGNNSLFGSMLERAGIDADKVREAIQTAFGTIKNIVLSVWGTVTAFLSEHGKQIREMFARIWDAVTQIFRAAFTVIAAVAAAAMPIFAKLQAFWEKWGDKIKTVFSTVAAFLGRTFERVISIITQLAEVISAIFAGDIGGALKSLLGIFQTIFEQILDVIKTIFTAVWTFIGDKVKAIKDSIVSAFTAAREDIKSAWGEVTDFFQSVWNGIAGVFNSAWEGVKSTVGKIKDSVVEGFTAAIDWIKNLPAQAVQWGADIIQGIVDGIKGAIGNVGEAVSGVAGKIKAFTGFSEPEVGPLSDFHTYMPDMVDLLTTGINANKGKIVSAMQSLCGDMSIMAKATVASPATAAAAMGTNNITRTIVQTNNFNQHFNGERAIQQKAAAAMKSSVADVTSELARGLAYAR